jgi:predicted negative regulator of RcsB-dependent stress response
VSELKTEEEQIEAFKTWWKKNGTSLVLAVSVGVAGYFGFQAWQQNQENHLAEASSLFESMSQAATDLSEEKNLKTVSFIADQLVNDFDDTGYATFAHLFQAKVDVVAEDYDAAIDTLNEAKASTDDVTLKAISDLRISKVLVHQGELDKALTQLAMINLTEFDSLKLELKGDVLLAQGKTEEARASYQAALSAQAPQAQNPLLDIKLQDLVES